MLSPSDTIAVIDTILDAFQHSRDYDYARELVPQHDENYFERLWHAIEDLFNSGNSAANNTVMEIPPWEAWRASLVKLSVTGLLTRKRGGKANSSSMGFSSTNIQNPKARKEKAADMLYLPPFFQK